MTKERDNVMTEERGNSVEENDESRDNQQLTENVCVASAFATDSSPFHSVSASTSQVEDVSSNQQDHETAAERPELESEAESSSDSSSLDPPSLVPRTSAPVGEQQDNDSGVAEGGHAEEAMTPTTTYSVSVGGTTQTLSTFLKNLLKNLCCAPFILFTSLLGTIFLLLFCILPVVIFLLVVLCYYYCCTRNPIPFNILWAALFQDDEESTSARTPLTRDTVQKALVRRICQEVHDRENKNTASAIGSFDKYAPGSLVLETANHRLLFSQPLDGKEAEGRVAPRTEENVSEGSHPMQGSSSVDEESGLELASCGTTQLHDDDESPGTCTSDLACDICLLEYREGDIVAWSPNPSCPHAYHEACVTDWFLRGHPTCPNCRCDYLLLVDDKAQTRQGSDDNV